MKDLRKKAYSDLAKEGSTDNQETLANLREIGEFLGYQLEEMRLASFPKGPHSYDD